MILKQIIKQTLPPFIWNYFRKILKSILQRKKNYDPRRWWSGEDLNDDGEQFKKIINFYKEQKFWIKTLNKESKDSIIIEKNNEVEFTFNEIDRDCSTLVFSFGQNDFKKLISGTFQIFLDEKPAIEIQDLISNKWNFVRVKLDSKIQKVKIKNLTNNNIFFGLPTFHYENLNNYKKIKNIFLIVMDQVDQETFFKLDKNKDLKAINYYLKNSLNFTNCQCPGDWTLPCFNSIFLGESPSHHGFFDLKASKNIKNILSENNLFNFLKEKKFNIFGISKSKGHHAGFGFHKFFNRLLFYEDIPDNSDEFEHEFSNNLIDNLRAHSDENNFCFMHYMSSHSPYYKPSYSEELNFTNKRISHPLSEFNNYIIGQGDTKIEPYISTEGLEIIEKRQKERLKKVDTLLGNIFSYLEINNILDTSMIILTADHGLPHGEKGKKILNDKWSKIPLKIFIPGNSEAKVYT